MSTLTSRERLEQALVTLGELVAARDDYETERAAHAATSKQLSRAILTISGLHTKLGSALADLEAQSTTLVDKSDMRELLESKDYWKSLYDNMASSSLLNNFKERP